MIALSALGCAKGGSGDGTGTVDASVGDGGPSDQGTVEPDLGPGCTGGDCCATAADCNDGVGCTRDECMVASGECVNTPVDEDCPDGTMCVAGMGCRLDTACEFDTDCPEPPPENNQLTRCADTMCELLCQDGFVDFDDDGSNGCECDSSGDDRPDLMFEDTNCDGIDGDEATAIFVDGASGSDSNPGTRAMPKATIQAGIDTAAGMGFDVYVSQGTYDETLSLSSGVGVYGGYQASMGWARATTAVVDISGGSTAVAGDSVDGVTLQLLSIRSANGSAPGESSVALRFASSSSITLEGLSLEAGAGASGTMGATGVTGASVFGTGGTGQPGCEESGGLCSGCSQPQGGAGGISPCGRTGGRGGNAGRSSNGGSAGDPGVGGTPGGPGGPSRGDGTVGADGADGGDGTDGGAGASFGMLGATGYVGAAGGDGTNGVHGNGGGGGGGGGGGTTNCDSYGSSGGGGGGGGCAGTAATGGGGGGASIALLLWSTDVAITDTELSTGTGGRGGRGGDGGPGGNGGAPGNGGPYGGSGEQDDGGDGARGGPGGDGGRGGHGGGGGGGPTVGIACGGGSALTSNARNNFSLGAAGDGGASSGQVGLRGVQVNRQGC